MTNIDQAEITRVLQTLGSGGDSAANERMLMVYEELRKIAGHYFKSEDPNHTLQPTTPRFFS